MKLLDTDLLRAAELLTEHAEELKRSTTCNGRWVSSDGSHERDKADHDEMLAIARRFRKIVGTL